MITLVLSDLRANARIWIGVFIVALAAGFAAGIGVGLLETAAAYDGPTRKSLQNASSPVLIFSGLTALVVLSSTANLTISLQRRAYALWQILNIRPLLVAVIVEAQLALVAAVGGAVGAALAAVVFVPVFEFVFATWNFTTPVQPHVTGSGLVPVVLGITGVVIVAGLRGARKAATTPPIQALTEPEPRHARMAWLRYVVTALAAAATYGLVSLMFDGDIQTITSASIFIAPAIIMMVAAAGPLLLPLTLRGWTWIIPARVSTSWFLARHSARYRVSQSTATVTPLMVGIGLAGGIYTCISVLAEYVRQQSGDASGYVLEPGQAILLMGGPLIAAVAAAATVFMSGGSRKREIALLQAAGASPRQIILAAVLEAIIYTLTATILGVLSIVGSSLIVSSSLGIAPVGIDYPSTLTVAAVGFVLILIASTAPTASALRQDVTRTLASA